MSPSETSFSRMPMSFREKSAWLCLATMLLFFVPYFIEVARLVIREQFTAGDAIGGFVGAVVFQVIVLIIAHIVVAIGCKDEPVDEPEDERDILIESRAVGKAYNVLAYTCLPAVVCIVLLSAAPSPTPWDHLISPAFISQVLLLCFVAAEATKFLIRALSYRRGS